MLRGHNQAERLPCSVDMNMNRVLQVWFLFGVTPTRMVCLEKFCDTYGTLCRRFENGLLQRSLCTGVLILESVN